MTIILHLSDFILLKVIAEAENPPTKRELWQPKGGGLWNAALKPYVRRGKCTLVKSDWGFNQAITRLRDVWLIEASAPYRATLNGSGLVITRGREYGWPLVVPVEGHSIIWEQAEY